MAYKRILVPIDGSPTSSRGLREAIGFAKAQKARLQLVHVVDVHDAVLLESLTGPAAGPIVRQARKWHADLIVIGTHGRRGLKRLVMGSDAEQIVRNAPAPVMLVRAG